MTNSTPHGDPYWAPTNFSDWNMYRIGGFVSFMLWFIAIILWAAIGWVALSKAKRKLILAEEEKGFLVLSASTDCLFGFLPIGCHLVSRGQKVRGTNIIKVTKFRCGGCPPRKETELRLADCHLTVQNRICHVYTLFAIFMALLFGLAFSFFAHFIPCIWWTCDLGYYDGEQIRGYIWFIGWPCFFFLFMLLSLMYQHLRIDIRPNQSNLGSKTLWVSIGNNHIIVANNFSLSSLTEPQSDYFASPSDMTSPMFETTLSQISD